MFLFTIDMVDGKMIVFFIMPVKESNNNVSDWLKLLARNIMRSILFELYCLKV